jgi:Flp pilus assembly protein TadG
MMRRQDPEHRRAGRAEGDDGVAVVEFAMVSVLLCLLIFGIIHFGLILSFKQDVTRAAAEGARAGAVAFPAVGAEALADPNLRANAWVQADLATRQAVEGFDQSCGAAMACNVNLHPCNATVPPRTPSNPTSRGDCVTVELVYDYANYPLLARIPIMSAFLPETIRASSVARLN